MAGWESEALIAGVDSARCSTVIEHADAQAALQPWIAMECYQLSAGAQLAQMDSLDLGHQQIVREQQTAAVQKLGTTPANLCTVSYCTPDPTFRFSELGASEAGSIYFMPGNTEFDLFVPAGAQTAYLSFEQDLFLSGARTLDPVNWEQAPQQIMSIPTLQPFALQTIVRQWLAADQWDATSGNRPAADLLRKLLMQDVLQLACDSGTGGPHTSSRERSRALQVCRATRAYVEDRLAADVVPTIVDICSLLSVSERTLQYAFRTYVDMAPLAYLRLCRLNKVRAILRASDPLLTTVTAIAMRFGFFHLGRFAIAYRRLFGETPSATLAS